MTSLLNQVEFQILSSLTEVSEGIATYFFYLGRSKLSNQLRPDLRAQKDAYQATVAASTIDLQNVQYASIRRLNLAMPEIEHLLLALFCTDESTGKVRIHDPSNPMGFKLMIDMLN